MGVLDMTKLTGRVAAALALAVTWGTVALAQGTGSEGYFEIHNNTGENIVVGFCTNDGTGWSDNFAASNVYVDDNEIYFD